MQVSDFIVFSYFFLTLIQMVASLLGIETLFFLPLCSFSLSHSRSHFGSLFLSLSFYSFVGKAFQKVHEL